jgi:hypothetical protein
MLKLHTASGRLEILNHGSLTEAAGEHPLFQGVRTWATAGLAQKPALKQDGGAGSVTCQSLTGQTLSIRLR